MNDVPRSRDSERQAQSWSATRSIITEVINVAAHRVADLADRQLTVPVSCVDSLVFLISGQKCLIIPLLFVQICGTLILPLKASTIGKPEYSSHGSSLPIETPPLRVRG